MRAFFLLLIVTAGIASAGEPRARAPIALTGSDALQRFEVPFDAYRDTRRDLVDVRVVNGRGETVPMAFAPAPEPERTAPKTQLLAQFPVTTRTSGGGSARLDVRVRSRADGTIVSIEERSNVKPGTRPIGYLLDASQLKEPVAALRFDWDSAPGSEIVKVTIESSDDLREWQTVASRSPLVRLEQAGQSLEQVRVKVGNSKAKYYRVTWDSGPFALRSVHAESAPSVKPLERKVTVVKSVKRGDDGELVFDLGARLPVEAVRVVFAEPNSVVQYEIAVQDAPDKPWRNVAAATFHRMDRDGVELTSSPVEIRRRARHWRLKPTVKPSGVQGPPPSLEVHWRPAEIVFVAKGEGPFHLEIGDPEARPADLPIANLMPNYAPRAERELAIATVGPAETREETPLQRYVGEVSPRKIALWAVLLLGVGVLAFMAWRLIGQMKAK